MLRLAADENFDHRILRGLQRLKPDLDLVCAQDVGLRATDDPIILEWAAQQGRILLTHDVTTITRYAYERVRGGKPMPGVFEVPQRLPVGRAVNDLLILVECSLEGEWEGQVRHLPL